MKTYRATKGMSSWGSDYRRQFMNKNHKKPISKQLLEIFRKGTEIHELYQFMLKEKHHYQVCPLYPFSDFIVIAHEHPVYKDIDGTLFTSNIDTVLLKGKEFILIDYKSCGKLPTEAKVANMIQLSIYKDLFLLPDDTYTISLHLCYIEKDNTDNNRWFEFTPLRVKHVYKEQSDLLNNVEPVKFCKEWCPCEHSKECGLDKTSIITDIEITEGKKGKYNTVFLENGDTIHGRFECNVGNTITYAMQPNAKGFVWCFGVKVE